MKLKEVQLTMEVVQRTETTQEGNNLDKIMKAEMKGPEEHEDSTSLTF